MENQGMEILQRIDRKFDSFEETIQANNELMREMLSELRTMNNTNALQLKYIENDHAELKIKFEEMQREFKVVQFELARVGMNLDAHNQNVLGLPKAHPYHNFNDLAGQWFSSKIGERLLWALGILVTGLIMHYINSK